MIFNQSAFRFFRKNIRMNKEILIPILLISFPVIVERIAFFCRQGDCKCYVWSLWSINGWSPWNQ